MSIEKKVVKEFYENSPTCGEGPLIKRRNRFRTKYSKLKFFNPMDTVPEAPLSERGNIPMAKLVNKKEKPIGEMSFDLAFTSKYDR